MESDFATVYFILSHLLIFLMGVLIIKWHFAIKSYKLWVVHFKSENEEEREYGKRILKEFQKEHAMVMEQNKEIDELHKLLE